MKLTAEAIKKINSPEVRRALAGILKCTEQTVIRYIHKNDDDGPLTILAALWEVEELTGMNVYEQLGLTEDD